MKINTRRQEGIRTGGGGVIKINNEDRRKGEKWERRAERRRQRKMMAEYNQNHNIFVIVWLSFPSTDCSQKTDQFALWWVKSAQVSSILFCFWRTFWFTLFQGNTGLKATISDSSFKHWRFMQLIKWDAQQRIHFPGCCSVQILAL